MIDRRSFMLAGLAFANSPLLAAIRQSRWSAAEAVLDQAVKAKQVEAAVLHVDHRGDPFTAHFGKAASNDAMFLLGSISKPINAAAIMTLVEQRRLDLDDRVSKFLPSFSGEGREKVVLRHLLTHVSGLPDQLAQNDRLRQRHAPLAAFVEETLRTPLAFPPGTRYQYSSMGILLAARVAEIVSGAEMAELVDRRIFHPLGMKHSAQGLGRFGREDFVACQMEGAAPESGGGASDAQAWNWNSAYWRKLGAPWGGTHASAPDVGRFLREFLRSEGKCLKPATARQMIQNHNPAGLTPRGLGFAVGASAGGQGCSDQTFGHTGSTGTLCWADLAEDLLCVVLTSLPGRAIQPHPRERASAAVAASVRPRASTR